MAYHPSEHYGENHFLRLGAAQGSLGVRKDNFARLVEENLHRLALGHGNRIFPVRYIGGLVTFRENSARLSRLSVAQVAAEYAITEGAQERIQQSEEEFARMAEAQFTVTPSGTRYLSARAIADLLGFSRVTVTGDWAKRPDLLPVAGSLADPSGVIDSYFTEATFNNFATWVRPGQPNPIPLTAS